MTTLRLREHPEALAELRAAARWYEGERPGLGVRFLDAVEAGLSGVLAWPRTGRPLSEHGDDPLVRRAKVAVFPYGIVYYVRAAIWSFWRMPTREGAPPTGANVRGDRRRRDRPTPRQGSSAIFPPGWPSARKRSASGASASG